MNSLISKLYTVLNLFVFMQVKESIQFGEPPPLRKTWVRVLDTTSLIKTFSFLKYLRVINISNLFFVSSVITNLVRIYRNLNNVCYKHYRLLENYD